MGAATFRYPGLLATIVASMDQMSGGRVELGLGTGWFEREHAAFGIPFPAPEGAVRPAGGAARHHHRAVGAPRPVTRSGFSFEGAHYRIEANRNPPRPVQSPYPPILVGGSGLRRTPAIAARYADEYNTALGGDLRASWTPSAGPARRSAVIRPSRAVPRSCRWPSAATRPRPSAGRT